MSSARLGQHLGISLRTTLCGVAPLRNNSAASRAVFESVLNQLSGQIFRECYANENATLMMMFLSCTEQVCTHLAVYQYDLVSLRY